jgi:putative RNA 2'-phosphotransferase
MSKVLRHQPELIGMHLDPNGWADVDELISGMNKKGFSVSIEDIKDAVRTNNKRRFAFSLDEKRIRARQGHSIEVDVEAPETAPPSKLYHGTALKFMESIRNSGLTPQRRLHVHLSADIMTAESVGRRHGKPVVLEIDAASMAADGFKFHLSENGVWLTQRVPVLYIEEKFAAMPM